MAALLLISVSFNALLVYLIATERRKNDRARSITAHHHKVIDNLWGDLKQVNDERKHLLDQMARARNTLAAGTPKGDKQ